MQTNVEFKEHKNWRHNVDLGCAQNPGLAPEDPTWGGRGILTK